MPLSEINKDAISFKKILGKAHTQFGFDITEESISSNVQIAFTTVFGETPNPNPVSNGGLSAIGATDGIVEKIRFEIDVIPDTEIGLNTSQGWALKLPAGYSGVLSTTYPAGTYLYEALGKLQIVPSLYGELKNDGSTEYDPVLKDTTLTQITKFDSINWSLDPYSGVLFVQDPTAGINTQPTRPAFLEAYLFVGDYLNVTLDGLQSFNAGEGINATQLSADTITVDLDGYDAPSNILMSFTGSSNFIVTDNSINKFGIRYAANYAPTFTNRSLVDKQYVDSVASGLSVKEAVQVASTGQTELSGTTIIDGITLSNDDRVLLKNQTDARENGIYVFQSASTQLVRATDFDQSSEVISGAFTSVISGNTNAATLWVVSSPDPITINLSNINWVALALPIVYVGGIGIQVNGQTIDLDGTSLAGIGIDWDSGLNAFNLAFSATTLGDGVSLLPSLPITTIGDNEVLQLRSIKGSGLTTVTVTGDTIIVNTDQPASSTIGSPDDGTYLDGLFSFTSGTTVANAIDPINEFLKALAPPFAPILDDIEVIGTTFVNGNLSFGVTRNDIGYTNVSTAAGNTAIDINGLYTASGTRKGIFSGTSVSAQLNEDVIGNTDGAEIPFDDNAFKYGNEGSIVVELNGSIYSILSLTSTTAATANDVVSVTGVKYSKFSTGAEFTSAPYRAGSFSIAQTGMTDGFNYVRVIHSGTSEGDIITNYLEWVYDSNTNNISGGTGTFDNILLNGSKFLSGVEYNTGGSIDYNVELANVYRNVYSNSNSAIQFTSRENLSDVTVLGMDITGVGIVNVSGQTSKILPILDTTVSNPESTNINIDASLQINSNIIIGSVGTTGRLRSSVTIDHPFSAKSYIGSQATQTGFLIYNISDSSNNQNENFTGELNRLEARDYSTLSYSNINGGLYNWDSTQSLTLGDSFHNTGMLVLNSSLYYPASSLLTTEYGITSGNFGAVTNSPVGNPDYSGALGERTYYRKFQSDNPSTQSTLTFTINHSGVLTDFLTNGGTAGTPTGNQVKFEFLIVRASNIKHGWANPFASTGNPEGIAVTSSNQMSGVITVNCTLSTTPRVGDGDFVIVRMKFADGYSNKINNVAITNI